MRALGLSKGIERSLTAKLDALEDAFPTQV